MKFSGKFSILLALVVAGLAVFSASRLLAPINQSRQELQLNWTEEIGRNVPPEFALTQAALGTFRGLAVNVLWQRATRLKEEGKYYEAMQLSDWITTLQPRFPHVWEFNAWNMAYNISVATHTPDERWMWVDAGIRLLRERGIPNNPHSLRLYRLLGWILIHKIGGGTDDMNLFYKARFCQEWDAILGAPPRTNMEDYLAWVHRFADAPSTLAELVRDNPGLNPIVQDLKAKGFDLNERLLRSLALEATRRELKEILKQDRVPSDFLPPEAILPEDLDDEALQTLLGFIRSRILVEKYHMEPQRMLELAERFGPFDWRLSASHAVYWGYVGLERTEERLAAMESPDTDLVNSDRLIFHGLQQLTYQGRVMYDPLSGYFNLLPEPRFIDAFETAFLTTEAKRGEEGMSSFTSGYRNFLEWSVRLAYVYGDNTLAYDVYGRLRDRFGDASNPDDKYVQPLEEFVLAEFQEFIDSQNDARQFVSGQLFQMITEGYANGDEELAERFLDSAKRVHDWYSTTQILDQRDQERLGLKPLEDMVADALAQFLQEPDSRSPVLLKVRVWNNVPQELQRKVFTRVRNQLYDECQASDLDPERAFPLPSGLSWPTPEERQREREAEGLESESLRQ